MKPSVSIIVPSYQKGKYIDSALASLAGQSVESWEAVIVDNGSVDDSVAIAKSWAARDRRFRSLDASAGPRNGSYCRNAGLREAAGEYVIFLDADDLLSATCLRARLEYAQQCGDRCFYVFPIETFVDEPGDQRRLWRPERKRPLSKLLFHRMSWHTMGTLWRREFITGLGGFDESYQRLQDVETHIRAILASNGNYAVGDKEPPTAFYRCCEGRAHKDSKATLLDFVESGKRFLTQMPLCLEQHARPEQIPYLCGTALELLQRLGRGVRTACVLPSEAETLTADLLGLGKAQQLWPPVVGRLLAFYWRAGERTATRIKGVNFCFRSVLWSLARP